MNIITKKGRGIDGNLEKAGNKNSENWKTKLPQEKGLPGMMP